MREKWMKAWAPNFPNGMSRLEFLLQLRAAVDKFERNVTVWVDRPTVFRITDRGILNYRQVASLLNISHEHVREIASHRPLLKPLAPRGLFDRYQLDMIYLLVQQLSLGVTPNVWMLVQLPDCGDPAIVSFLSGVPQSTINRYRKTREVSENGFEYRQRVADVGSVHTGS